MPMLKFPKTEKPLQRNNVHIKNARRGFFSPGHMFVFHSPDEGPAI